jgi:uncharacterized membrane protein YgcG
MKKILFLILIFSFITDLFANSWSDLRNMLKGNKYSIESVVVSMCSTCSPSKVYLTYSWPLGINYLSSGTGVRFIYKGKFDNPDEEQECKDVVLNNGDKFICSNNDEVEPQLISPPANGVFDDDGNIICESGFENQNGSCYKSMENGYLNDNGNLECHEGFTNNGDYCVPNTPPNPCGSGYAKTGMNGLTNEPICYPDSDGNGTADILENNLPPAPDVPYSGVQIDGNGTKRWDVGGNSYELTKDGTLTTTYADGTTSVKNLGSDYYNSGSSGGSATGGTGGTGGSGGSGSTGNTINETNPNQNDTPIDDTPAANSCQDSSLTLQEKMLCEMNAGMKKLNSESNTENSLNNLLKDLNNTSNTNATAINTNIKETNKKLDSVKALNENQLAEQKKTNDKLRSVENGIDGSNLLLEAANTKLEQVRDNLQDEEGKSYLSKISDFFTSLTTPTSDEDKNSYSSQMNNKVSSTLNNTFSKYSNVLGFGSTYANRPENITITLFNQEYTLLDFSVFDAYVSIIRSLFLTLAYLYGFMNLIKGSK